MPLFAAGRRAPPVELERVPESLQKTGVTKKALHKALHSNDDLARIAAAWPTLPAPIRRPILALIG